MVSFRNIAVFIGIVGMMFGLASMVDAAQRAPKRASTEPEEMRGGPGKPEMILQGPVLSVSPGTGFIVIRHGAGRDTEEIPIEIDRQTTLMRGGRSANVDDIRVGDRVRVRYSGQLGDVSKTVDVMTGAGTRRGTRG
jgi:hypothetical protein